MTKRKINKYLEQVELGDSGGLTKQKQTNEHADIGTSRYVMSASKYK